MKLSDKVLRPLQLEFVKIDRELGIARDRLWNYNLGGAVEQLDLAEARIVELRRKVNVLRGVNRALDRS